MASVYHGIFKLTTPLSELENILADQENSLKVFCDYVSEHAIRQVVSPIVIMGKSCMTAAIYKTLICKLNEKGINTNGIQPSSKFAPLFRKHGGIILSEVSKLAPGALSKFELQENWIVKMGALFNLIFFFLIIIVSVIWHFHWTLFIPLFLGITITAIGNRFKPAKEVIGGYDTMRDLILGMESQMRKAG